jgi:hypothetical protein
MKKILIYVYAAGIVVTLVAYAVFSFFNPYNALFCTASLLVSLAISIAAMGFKIDPVYKIALLIGISALATICYLISMFMPHYTSNNIALFIVIILTVVEVLVIAGAKYFTRFA